jgi:NADH:ubiquinone oxidoreductase subunit F (NADH-binding)
MAKPHWLIPSVPYGSYAQYLADAGAPLASLLGRAPDAIVDELRRSGLRGRGGAGFPTGIKWQSLLTHSCPTRYVVCNAAEGEPATFKDRVLLRQNPYAVLEGMRIAAHVIGARAGYLALKASSTTELARMRAALAELSAAGALDGFPLEIVEGPEEYLFGEEKALLNVIEGEGPLPRSADSPPYEVGLFALPGSPNPALVNNAETFAHVPSILGHGADSFRRLGTSDTPGTVLFTVCGDVARPGVYELEAGVPLGRLFHEIAGGPRPGRTLKAALSGVSAGVIAAERFDTPADFGSLASIGAGLGAAGFLVLDDQRSIPRVAQAAIRFLYVESCNQCSACKAELRLASRALDELFEPGDAAPQLLDRALVAAQHAPQGNRCYLPVQASLLLPSLLKRFAGEFDAQAQTRSSTSEPFVIPKIADFDEQNHAFVYDRLQPLKRPDWTYPEPHTVARPAAPARHPPGPVTVRLDEEVVGALDGLTDESKGIEEVANRALRAWLGLDAK